MNSLIDSQLLLFPELEPTEVEPRKKRSSHSTTAIARYVAPQHATRTRELDRRQTIERLGGSWGLLLHTGRKIVAPGTSLYLPTGRQVGVYKIENATCRWGMADLYCFALRGLELEFGFLNLGFLADPERYVRDRQLDLWHPKQLWEYEPPEEVQKRPRLKPSKAELEEIPRTELDALIWEWLCGQFPNRQRREEIGICLKERDRLPLNNALAFCQKELIEVAQKLRKRFPSGEFDRRFWTLLELIAS